MSTLGTYYLAARLLRATASILFLGAVSSAFAQTEGESFGGDASPAVATVPCLSEGHRARIEAELAASLEALGFDRTTGTGPEAMMTAGDFTSPMRAVGDLPYAHYVTVSNYVDQDRARDKTRDAFCGSITYDGHRGVDWTPWPFPQYLQAADKIEIVAVAPGTIIARSDGRADESCALDDTKEWNAAYVRHDDGSVTWYGHLKRNSVTTKRVGDRVERGEYLGIMASSGNSTGPHLHLETYAPNGELVEPFAASCNSVGPNESYWRQQEAYRPSLLHAVLTHDAPPAFGCPASREQQNFSDQFEPGDRVYFGRYYSNQRTGQRTISRVLMPSGRVWQSYSQTFADDFLLSWWYNFFNLPTDAEQGTWTFETTYSGQVVRHEFTVGKVSGLRDAARAARLLRVSPNPSTGEVRFADGDLEGREVTVVDVLGRATQQRIGAGGRVDLRAYAGGVYILRVAGVGVARVVVE